MNPVMVFAPSPILTVTIERRGEHDDVHVHAGGQGCWVARMLRVLDIPVTLCGYFGGETGVVIRTLLGRAGIGVVGVGVEAPGASYVHDRRGGEREELAQVTPPPIGR